ncbi:hypothetical protein ACFPRL_03955 [Pseudoclavibacter helvolus]
MYSLEARSREDHGLSSRNAMTVPVSPSFNVPKPMRCMVIRGEFHRA